MAIVKQGTRDNELFYYQYDNKTTHYLLCISTSERMLAHAFAWLKTIENIRKLTKNYLFHHVHERLMRGSCVHFPIFSIVFDHANACASMRSLVEIHNRIVLFVSAYVGTQCVCPFSLRGLMLFYLSFTNPLPCAFQPLSVTS